MQQEGTDTRQTVFAGIEIVFHLHFFLTEYQAAVMLKEARNICKRPARCLLKSDITAYEFPAAECKEVSTVKESRERPKVGALKQAIKK